MISVKEALELVAKHSNINQLQELSINDSCGMILGENVYSPISFPPFDQSAMDGFAIKLNGDAIEFRILGEIKAGDDASNLNLQPGEAYQIYTGAMCPKNVDLICRVEDTETTDQKVRINKFPKLNANIRPAGEQINEEELALEKGIKLTPASVGFLATLGIEKIKCYSVPKVSVISTGNELVERSKNNNLPLGKIYESNGLMLIAALKQCSIYQTNYHHVDDDLTRTFSIIKEELLSADILLITGGISVGEYDFVEEALGKNGVEKIFYKVNQKPGKPLFFGKKENKLVFALPGNPAAALTCFYIYVWPAIQQMMGFGFQSLSQSKLPVNQSVNKPNDREQFLKARIEGEKVHLLEGQSSAMLQSFAASNGLIYIPDGTTVETGELVDVIKLP